MKLFGMLAVLGMSLSVAAGCAGPDEAGDAATEVEEAPSALSSSSAKGELGPLIAMHKDAIHMGLFWDAHGKPKVLFWMRPSEYRGTDLVDPAVDPAGELRPKFAELVYGGFNFSNTLDASVKSRIKDDIHRENALILDLKHPDALANRGKYRPEDLDEEDFAMNAGAFSDAGSSKGLHYNIFCAGHAVLADGRWAIFGGHDKGGNNGIKKVNIFDPFAGMWADRPIPPVKADYLKDPTGDQFPHADALDEDNTDPHHRSDMKYQRWYPTAVTLPDGDVLVMSGTDQDTSKGPDEASATKVRQAVPEIFDPETGKTTALKNAKKLLPMYPRTFVVQTGHRKKDWKVAVVAEVQPPLPTPAELEGFDPWRYNGNTNLLDVQAAWKDKHRDEPGERHWELVTTAEYAHEGGASVALWKLDDKGHAVSQKVVLFGGDSGTGDPVAAVEMIDFSDRRPKWERQDDLVHPATQNNAVTLADGRALVVGGRARGGGQTILTYEYQLFDPDTGKIEIVATTHVPRHDHSTVMLAPDGSVWAAGGNRTEIVPGDADAGVPVLQIYKPDYLFKGPRPIVESAPARISYHERFQVKLSHGCKKIGSVALVRMEPVTHNWSWGNRHIQLAFEEKGKCRLSVRAPAAPGLAPPGVYMLFVLNKKGVPSMAQHLRLD